MINIHDKVKLSARFLRSIGGHDPCAESVGEVVELVDAWLAGVKFPEGHRNVNVHNLVHVSDVAAEARAAEHGPNAVHGLHIGRRRRS